MRIPGGALFRDAVLPDARPAAAAGCWRRMPRWRWRWSALTVATAAEAAVRALFLRRRRRHAVAVPCRRRALMRAGRPAAGADTAVGAARAGQPAPARRADAADAGLGRARPVHAGGGRADRGQHPPRRSWSRCRTRRRASSSSTSRTTSWRRSAHWSRTRRGCSDFAEVPSLRARIVAVNGVPVDRVRTTPDTAWALRGDRGLTYAAAMPDGTRLVAGRVVAAGLRRAAAGVVRCRRWRKAGACGVGDTHPGERARPRHRPPRRQPARHRLAHARPSISPWSPAPACWSTRRTRISRPCAPTPADAGGTAAGGHRRAAERLRHPRRRRAGRRSPTLLGQIGAALAATGSLTLAAGALVLAGAVAAGQRRRIREAVILKSLGATRGADPRGLAGRVRHARASSPGCWRRRSGRRRAWAWCTR